MAQLTMTGVLVKIHEDHLKKSHNKLSFNPIKQYSLQLHAGQRKPRGYQ